MKQGAYRRLDPHRDQGQGPALVAEPAGELEGEGVQLACKERLGKDHNRVLAETVAAFANPYGGVIILGREHDATVVGYDPPKLQDTITSIIRCNVSEYVERRSCR